MNMVSYSCCSPDKKKFHDVTMLSSQLKLLAEKNRLQILCILRQNKHCVCEINEHIKASQSLISHHLKDLREGGIIKDSKKGLKVFYSLTPIGRHLTDLIFSISVKGRMNK